MLTATHLTTHAPAHVLTPADTTDASWAAGEIATLIRHVGPGTAAALVLRQAQRELESLASPAATVIGPLRVKRAA